MASLSSIQLTFGYFSVGIETLYVSRIGFPASISRSFSSSADL